MDGYFKHTRTLMLSKYLAWRIQNNLFNLLLSPTTFKSVGYALTSRDLLCLQQLAHL